jgi:uncharacterized protein YrrD
MRLGKDLIGRPIYSIDDGRLLGTTKDLFLDLALKVVSGLYLGSEGLFSRKTLLIQRSDISVYGVDALLVKGSYVVSDSEAMPSVKGWLRREQLQRRNVDTAGGTKVGTVGDVLISDNGEILGYYLSKVHVSGPMAEHRKVLNDAVLDTGSDDDAMTIDLSAAEQPSAAPAAPEPQAEAAVGELIEISTLVSQEESEPAGAEVLVDDDSAEKALEEEE